MLRGRREFHEIFSEIWAASGAAKFREIWALLAGTSHRQTGRFRISSLGHRRTVSQIRRSFSRFERALG